MKNEIQSRKWKTRIKALRARRGMTQEQLAQAIGVSWVSVARWESKKGSSPSNMAKRQIEALENNHTEKGAA